MPTVSDALPRRYVIFEGSFHSVVARRTVLILLCGVFPVAIFLASLLDQTLRLPDDGVGLLRHYGLWTFMLTVPVVITLSSRLLTCFFDTLRNLDALLIPGIDRGERDRVAHLLTWEMGALRLRGRYVYFLNFLTVASTLFAVNSIVGASLVRETFGHDTFDSFSHPWGFFVAKTYTLFVFTFVYPVTLFVAFRVTVSMVKVFRFLHRRAVLQIDILHVDNCGGMARFGRMNKQIIVIYTCLFLVASANYLTHGLKGLAWPLLVNMFAVMVLVQWIGGVYYLHLALEAGKRERLQLVSDRLKEAERAALRDGIPFPTGLLEYRNHLLGVNTYPYGPDREHKSTEVSPASREGWVTNAAADREYDVCLSFAGEDRAYVDAVAVVAAAQDIRIFYDAYEAVELWGKDLYQHLTEVYQKKAAYCVIFISAAYARKLWTKHELRAAQARAFTENEEYILPARFDDTSVPGILPTTGYIDLTKHTPEQFATLLVQKIRSRTRNAPRQQHSAS
jgi:hypothetical protein